jgi:hypothetical protein
MLAVSSDGTVIAVRPDWEPRTIIDTFCAFSGTTLRKVELLGCDDIRWFVFSPMDSDVILYYWRTVVDDLKMAVMRSLNILTAETIWQIELSDEPELAVQPCTPAVLL